MKLLSPPERLAREDFERLLRRFLPGLPRPALSSLQGIHELRIYQAGDTLMEEGRVAAGVFVLRVGTASVCLRSPSGASIGVREIVAPAILGVSETMLAEKCKATVRCESRIEAVLLPALLLIPAIRQFPRAGLEFSRVVSQELNTTYSILAEIRCPSSLSRDSSILRDR